MAHTWEKMRTLWPRALRCFSRRSSSCILPHCSSSSAALGNIGEGSSADVMRSGWLQFLRICIKTLFSRDMAAPRCPFSTFAIASCTGVTGSVSTPVYMHHLSCHAGQTHVSSSNALQPSHIYSHKPAYKDSVADNVSMHSIHKPSFAAFCMVEVHAVEIPRNIAHESTSKSE